MEPLVIIRPKREAGGELVFKSDFKPSCCWTTDRSWVVLSLICLFVSQCVCYHVFFLCFVLHVFMWVFEWVSCWPMCKLLLVAIIDFYLLHMFIWNNNMINSLTVLQIFKLTLLLKITQTLRRHL